MTYTVRNLKTFRSDDGGGFSCILMKDGKRVAEIVNDGNGGCFKFWWDDRQTVVDVKALTYDDKPHVYKGSPEEAALWATCMAIPQFESYGIMMSTNPDMFVEDLVGDLEVEKAVKRLLKHYTILDGEAVLQWKNVTPAQHPKLREHIAAKYPNAIYLSDIPFADAVKAYKKAQ